MTAYELDDRQLNWAMEHDDAIALKRHERGFLPFFLAAFCWGMGTGFSHLAVSEELAYFVQGPALILSLILGSLVTFRTVTAWASTKVGRLMALNVAVAVFSGLVNESHPAAIIRFALLVPAMSLLLAGAQYGSRARDGLRAGLTVSGVLFVVYHIVFLDPTELTNPMYRVSLFLNPNGVGFIAAMTGISLLDYAVERLTRHGKLFFPIACLTCVVACVVLCVATKSRTAMLVFTVGVLLRLYLSLGFTRTFLLSVAGMFVVFFLAWGAVSSFGEKFAEIFQINDRLRGVEGGTGRFRAWGQIIGGVWLPNFWIGVGPNRHMALVSMMYGISSAHNGLLAYLCDTGILGTLPLIGILVISARRVWALRRDSRYYFAAALFLAGLVESGAETMFFSIGNPGSLMFLLAVSVLATAEPAGVPAADGYQGPDPHYVSQV